MHIVSLNNKVKNDKMIKELIYRFRVTDKRWLNVTFFSKA